jgi:hypothetical protein
MIKLNQGKGKANWANCQGKLKTVRIKLDNARHLLSLLPGLRMGEMTMR